MNREATASCRLPRGLLVSVRTADEAVAARAGGAAIIDVKEPANGPLGVATTAVAAAIGRVVGDTPWTLACGELAAGADHVAKHVRHVIEAGGAGMVSPAAAKAGPAGLDATAWRREFARLVARLPAGVEPVAVAYADHGAAASPAPAEIIAAAAAGGAATVLVDTFLKTGPGIVALAGLAGIRAWQRLAVSVGVRLALAGRLTPAELAAVARCGAWVIGVRSAACGGDRNGRVDARQVAKLVGTLERGEFLTVNHVVTGA